MKEYMIIRFEEIGVSRGKSTAGFCYPTFENKQTARCDCKMQASSTASN